MEAEFSGYNDLSEQDRRYVDLISEATRISLLEGEDAESVLRGAWHIASRRAQISQRRLRPEDYAVALSIFCWWPMKAEMRADISEALRGARRVVFQDIDSEATAAEKLNDVVPDELLQNSFGDLMQLLENGEILSHLRLPLME